MATDTITKTWAADLLERTSTNNHGRIGSPTSRDGYSLDSALAMLRRAEQVRLSADLGLPVLVATLPGQGDHTWYLSLTPPAADPWA